MKCSDIMKTDIECISPECSIQKAAGLMREVHIGFLPVCEEGLHVVGTLTDRDIAVRGVAAGFPSSTAVEDLMTRDVVACDADDDVERARELMDRYEKSCIVCVNRLGQLEGVISLSDIAQLDESTGLETLRRVPSREARI